MELAASPKVMSPLSPMGPNEELFLEKFFHLVGNFAADKAKELADKEKETKKGSFGQCWPPFVQSLAQFATAEKMYMCLGFLEQKGFFTRSKDSPKELYQSLSQQFRRVEDLVRNQEVHHGMPHPLSEFEQLIGHLSGQLYQFVSARQKTMEFYEQVNTMGQCKNINFQDLVMVISEIMQTHSRSFHHPLLSDLKSKFWNECEIINHLLQTQILVTEWQFLPSLIQLNNAHTKLSSWGAAAYVKEQKKSTFGSSSKQSTWPALYSWLLKYKDLLVSKFSLYFYELLQKQTHTNEMKAITAKLSEDFVSRIIVFHKRSDATHIALVMDTNGIVQKFKGPGYHFPTRYAEEPKGLDSFPAIFSYPGEKPLVHWPNVVMMINRLTDAQFNDKITCVYDKNVQSTYFLNQVDARITLVVIFESKKSEKDTYVNNFITELRTCLNCARLFTSLKPGIK